ncbi:unnamed protein product, partial [Ectocarpus sp. 8 AP-2014]
MLLVDETFLHELMRTYRRALPPPPPPPPPPAAIPHDNAAVSEPGRLRVADGDSGGGNSDRRSRASVEQPGEGVAAHTTSGVPAASACREEGSTAAEVVPAGGGEREEASAAADNGWMNAASDDVMREGGERQQRSDI